MQVANNTSLNVCFIGAACPLGKRFGRKCSVSDDIAGYSFDLSPLANARPIKGKDYFSHLDSRKEYEYQIKVCLQEPISFTLR